MKKKMIAALSCAAMAASMLQLMPANAADDEYLIRDKWGYCTSANYVESEHFVIFYGNNDTTGLVDDAFLKRNLEDYEKLWKCYSEYLGMNDINVDIYGRSQQKYKTNVYLTFTGLDHYPDGWAYMSAEDGYGIEIISPEAMKDDLTTAHEFGHVVTMQQKAWVDQDITGAWWEPLANWFREMYLGSEYYTGNVQTCWFEPYIRNMSLTLPHGRNYYEVWPFLVYISYNPDNLPGLGIDAVKRIISEAEPGEYPFDTITRLFGTDAQTVFANYAKRMATFDFGAKAAYQNEFSKKLKESPFYWNLFYTVPEEGADGWLHSPQSQSPMQGGINVIPLTVNGGQITAELKGLSDDPNAAWQACIVTVDSAGKESYSGIFGSGETMTVSSEGAVSAYMTVSAMPDELYKVNAFHKDNVSSLKDGDERRRYPYEIRIEGAGVQQTGGYSKGAGHIHPNGGGWVDDSASVADSVYVAPNAMVLGSASLSGNARVEDSAIVAGTTKVSDNAVICGHAIVDGGGWIYENDNWVLGTVSVSGNAVIGGRAVVMNSCTISGNAKILQNAYLADAVTVTDDAAVKGMSYIYGKGIYSGSVILDGDYCNNQTKNSGIGFGWLDDYGWHTTEDGFIAAYDFSDSSGNWVKDKYTTTNALKSGAEWSQERTSASGVLSFSGGDDCLEIDSDLFRSKDLQISLAALWKGGSGGQEIFRIGDEKAYIAFTPSSNDNFAELTITDGNTTEKLSAPALEKGKWSKITVRIIGGKSSLLINGEVADSKSISLDAAAVLGASENDSAVIGKGFKGAVDYMNLSFKEVAEPALSYAGSEEPDDGGEIAGDVNADGTFNVADLVLMQEWLLGKPGVHLNNWKAGDICNDGKLNTFDLVRMRELLASGTNN